MQSMEFDVINACGVLLPASELSKRNKSMIYSRIIGMNIDSSNIEDVNLTLRSSSEIFLIRI